MKLLKQILLLLLIPAILFAAPPDQVDFLIGGLTNSSGQPLAGGKVYTYTAGTTSNKTTWQDYAKTTPHANPIVLDSQGKKLVFADGSYKFRIDDSSDTTQYTLDNLKFGRYITTDYQFTTYTPTLSVVAPFTFTSTSIATARYIRLGNLVFVILSFSGTAGGTLSNIITAQIPSSFPMVNQNTNCAVQITDGGTIKSGASTINSTTALDFRLYNGANYTAGTVGITAYCFYEGSV